MVHSLLVVPALLMVILGAALTGAEARTLSGSLTYRERIALPEGAEWRIEVTARAGAITTHSEPTEGRQVPFDFRFDVPEGPLVLRAAIFVEGRPVWRSGPVPVPEGAEDAALGRVQLQAHIAQPFRSWLLCGDQIFGLGFDGDDAVLSLGEGVRRLPPAISASGTRFADEEGENEVWLKGAAATIRWQRQEMAACRAISMPPDAGLTARGNEPGWVLRLDADGAALSTEGGTTLEAAPLPEPDPSPGSLHWIWPDLSVTLSAGPCADSMSGMPYPLAAEVMSQTGRFTGCAGDPMLLLQGAWRVVALADFDLAGAQAPQFTVEGDRISGQSGCNRFTAGLALDGEGLRPAAAAVTRMACPPDRMTLEAAFLEALGAVDRFDIDSEGRLLLIGADREMIRAER